MAPELPFFMSSLPEAKLKVVIQANAVSVALFATACMAASTKISRLFALTSPIFSMLVGFCLALTSALLFRLTVKQPVPSRFVILVAVSNILVSVLATALVISGLVPLSLAGSATIYAIAAVLCVFGLTQFILLSRSSHTYQQTDAVAV